MSEFVVSSDQNKLDFEVIHAFISATYWANNIPRDTLKKAIANSLAFGVYDKGSNLVGFARVIGDKATFAYLADVFVLPDYRGLGLSRLLMEHIVAHPEVQGLRRFMLATRDAHGLYEKFGFQAIENAQPLMQIWHPTIYATPQTEQVG